MNVAPQFSQFAFFDSGGSQVNSVVPWVLTGLPVRLDASFTDPGTLDHQFAQISWEGGQNGPDTVLDSFDEAFGDGTGSLPDSHVFNAPGTYPVQFAVADDDGGFDIKSADVRVVTPEQAVIELIAMIDAVIASTTDTQVLADLQKARHALTGSNENSHNGALKMIRAGENEAAAAFALTSVTWLQRAAEGGADVAVPSRFYSKWRRRWRHKKYWIPDFTSTTEGQSSQEDCPSLLHHPVALYQRFHAR